MFISTFEDFYVQRRLKALICPRSLKIACVVISREELFALGHMETRSLKLKNKTSWSAAQNSRRPASFSLSLEVYKTIKMQRHVAEKPQSAPSFHVSESLSYLYFTPDRYRALTMASRCKNAKYTVHCKISPYFTQAITLAVLIHFCGASTTQDSVNVPLL